MEEPSGVRAPMLSPSFYFQHGLHGGHGVAAGLRRARLLQMRAHSHDHPPLPPPSKASPVMQGRGVDDEIQSFGAPAAAAPLDLKVCAKWQKGKKGRAGFQVPEGSGL